MCDLCSRAKAARLSWGHGDEGDRLIYQHEGVEVLERLQMIEAAILPKHYPLADLDIRL